MLNKEKIGGNKEVRHFTHWIHAENSVFTWKKIVTGSFTVVTVICAATK